MDKVIIDNVDVSECNNLAILQDRMTDKEFTFCNAYQEDCSERENCHYKQLQRARAEIDELKKENKILDTENREQSILISDLTRGIENEKRKTNTI